MAKVRIIERPPAEVRAVMQQGGLLHRLTQVGFVARGVVYLLVGVLALMLAALGNGETTDSKGAVRRIAEQPFGEFALLAMAAGLIAYAVWRLIGGIFNSDRVPADMKGRFKRIGFVLSAIAHGALAFYAIQVLRGAATGGDQTRAWTARLMQAPVGWLLVILVGIGVVVAGVVIIRNAFKESFLQDLRTGEMSGDELRWTTRVGKWGNAARGVVFGIIGLFLLFAGWGENSREAKGFEGALDTLAAQPMGNALLGAVAFGLALFGVFCLVEARYRRIRT